MVFEKGQDPAVYEEGGEDPEAFFAAHPEARKEADDRCKAMELTSDQLEKQNEALLLLYPPSDRMGCRQGILQPDP